MSTILLQPQFLNTQISQLAEIDYQEGKYISISHIEYHGWWWPGNVRNQSISSYDTELDCPQSSTPCMIGVVSLGTRSTPRAQTSATPNLGMWNSLASCETIYPKMSQTTPTSKCWVSRQDSEEDHIMNFDIAVNILVITLCSYKGPTMSFGDYYQYSCHHKSW